MDTCLDEIGLRGNHIEFNGPCGDERPIRPLNEHWNLCGILTLIMNGYSYELQKP